jgi:glycosyltransferase involved in cell wall biosynthesis
MATLEILQLADHSEILSGGATQMLLLARGLRERGHDVTCVFDSAPSPLQHTLEQVTRAGCRLVRVPMGKKETSVELRALLETRRFDVIHTHRASYKPLFRSCRDLDLPPVVVNRGQSRPLRTAELAKMLHPAVRAHVVVAAHVKNVLTAAGIPADRVEVIYGSYDETRFHPGVDGSAVRCELLAGAPDAAPLVGIVAKLSHYKSHDVFLAAAARVLERFPAARFAVVGPDPEGAAPQLAALARDLGARCGVPLGERVRFTGPRQDIPQVLAALDVSVSASALPWEGLSGVMRESLATARPVVCTDVGGNRELVRDGETGRLVPPGDPAALADAVTDLLAHPDRARAMAQRGHALARATFSNAARALRMEALYRRLLAEAAAAS